MQASRCIRRNFDHLLSSFDCSRNEAGFTPKTIFAIPVIAREERQEFVFGNFPRLSRIAFKEIPWVDNVGSHIERPSTADTIHVGNLTSLFLNQI